MKRAFLEQINGEWLDDFVYISKQPLIDMGFMIIPFDGDDLENTLKNKYINKETDVCIGSVEACNCFFTLCGIEPPKYLGYPEELKGFLGREIKTLKYSELGDNFPYFVKPATDVKLFTGDIIIKKTYKEYLATVYGCKADTMLYQSELVNFVSEYRVFVHEGRITGMKNYLGDFMVIPNKDTIYDMVLSFKSSPIAYTLDVGITDDGTTLLVEVNDMWAIGSYGLNGKDYALACVRRMKEILNNRI